MQESRDHPLRGLLVAQFFGAFNDNAWKLLVAFLGIRAIAADPASRGPGLEALSQTRTTLAFVAFTLPLVLFSLPAGVLADRLSKRSIILAMKAVEVVLMVGGTLALWLNPAGGVAALVILALMGAQSALFSPAKYGILPELLPHDRLSWGNGVLEMWTFVAIIAGTGAGGILLDAVTQRTWVAGLLLTSFAVVGFVAAFGIPTVVPARSDGGLSHTVKVAFGAIRGERILGLAVAGSVLFWAVASLLGQDIIVYARGFLRVSDARASALLAAYGLGGGGGSLLAGKLSASKVEWGLIPMGAVGLGALTFLLGSVAPGFWGTFALLLVLGLSSGLLVVPLNSLIQWRAPADRRGAVIAVANAFVFAGILAGSLGAQMLSMAGLSARQILVAASVATLSGTAWALWLLPAALLRLVLVLLTHTFYRLTVFGRANVPTEGSALLVPNHVSFADGLFLMASLDRPVRFIVDAGYFNQPFLRPFMKALGAIPISTAGGPRVILRAFRDAGRSLDAGHLVCIFAEGQITRTGMLLPFRRGLERIARGRSAPIIPVHLDRVWGSIFSHASGRFLTKLPERVPYPVTVSFGLPLAAGAPPHDVRQAVQELDAAAWILRKPDSRPLHRTFVKLARRHPLGFAFADGSRPHVSRFKALVGTIVLARALREPWRGQDSVGILLPPSVPAALVNLAAALSGRTSVNFNYTAGRAAMESAARQAGLRSVVTSRLFLDKANLQLPNGVEPVCIEDAAAAIGRVARLTALVLALLAPVRMLEWLSGAKRAPRVDDLATVIFSSGSTGEPKGVLLSHFNIGSNLEAAAQAFGITRHDRILGVLPFFHSFGYFSLWLGATRRLGIVFHPSPLDAAAIGDLIQRYRLTFLLATPTFLQLYLRRCTPAQFGSLRIVLTGAEKLSDRLAEAFEEQFGIRPLEGYGTTECAPAIAVSVPDYRAPGFYQSGSRRGCVGQPLPGVAVRVVDPDTFAMLPPRTPGMLLVKGPNVMQGYLGRPDLTAEVVRDGWYVTGDIAAVDDDGFIRIVDRLSRFSKIGGEMVPHGRVEEALHEAAEAGTQVFAVASVPDERKGERLAVLHTLDAAALPPIVEKLAAAGLPNLFIPRLDSFVKVDRLPLLGSGKLDLRAIKQIAIERLQQG